MQSTTYTTPDYHRLELEIGPQPDDTTCGPTCLHAVYSFFGDHLLLTEIASQIPLLETGGTLAVQLACHALKRGYGATIYSYNLQLFDPTWLDGDPAELPSKLRAQAAAKNDAMLRVATTAYLEFLALGGKVRFEDLTPRLIRRHLYRNRPILTGLSATFLYGCAREVGDTDLNYDDVRGVPVGHFVVLYGYDRQRKLVLIADPTQDNPRYGSNYYSVALERAIGAILLGVMTYDANLLVLEPPVKRKHAR